MCRKAGPPSSRGARSCEARWGRSARAGASPPPRPAAARALNRPAGAARAASHEGGRVAARRGAGPRMCRGLPSRAVICRRGGARRRVGGARPRARRGRAGAASRGAARRAAARAGSAAPLLMRRRSCLCVAGAGAGVTVMLVAQSPVPSSPDRGSQQGVPGHRAFAGGMAGESGFPTSCVKPWARQLPPVTGGLCDHRPGGLCVGSHGRLGVRAFAFVHFPSLGRAGVWTPCAGPTRVCGLWRCRSWQAPSPPVRIAAPN